MKKISPTRRELLAIAAAASAASIAEVAPAAAQADWAALTRLMAALADARSPWPDELSAVNAWYTPHLRRKTRRV